jgi:hypothetical protein
MSASGRGFTALIDQDSVVVLEYQQEKAGFRVTDSRRQTGRFTSAEAAAEAVLGLLGAMNAKRPSLAIVLQHFGSFFHTLVLPPASDEHTRLVIQREVERSFNITDAAIAYTSGASVERREGARAGGPVPRQVLIAGAPRTMIEGLTSRLAKGRVTVEGITIIPEVSRRLFDTLDGSTEATVLLMCLPNGPHVTFFVNGQLELAIEPPLSLDGEAPLDLSVIVDQLERGAIFLRQQTRGTVATRVLLSAPPADFESLSSAVEARTGMRVVPLGNGIGDPETVLAMGAVIASRGEHRLDLVPRAPSFEDRLKKAMTGPALLSTTLLAFAAVAAFWCVMQVAVMQRRKNEVASLQTLAQHALPAVDGLRQSVSVRERTAAIRASLHESATERRALAELLLSLSSTSRAGTQLDSVTMHRKEEGLHTTIYGRAVGASGPVAMSAATGLYQQFRSLSGLKGLDFESAYLARATPDVTAEMVGFTISFVTSSEGKD